MKLEDDKSFQIDIQGSKFPEGFSIEMIQPGSNLVESVRFFDTGSSWHFENENNGSTGLTKKSKLL